MFVILPTLIAIVNFICALILLNNNITLALISTVLGFMCLFIAYVNMRD